MTDKVQKIREEVERLQDACMDEEGNIMTAQKQGAYDVLCKLDAFIDSMQKESSIPDIVDEHFDEMLGEEPVSEDLEEASKEWLSSQLDKSYAAYGETKQMELTHFDGYAMLDAIEFGANWQKNHLWKPADGDDLPEYDREVITLLDNGKVAFAHRPNPEGWDAKSIITEKIERYIPETYGKGGWNIQDVKWWLDCNMPKVEED